MEISEEEMQMLKAGQGITISDEDLEMLRVANNFEQLAKDLRTAVKTMNGSHISACADAARVYAYRIQNRPSNCVTAAAVHIVMPATETISQEDRVLRGLALTMPDCGK